MGRLQDRAGTPPLPLRASDAEREQVVGQLRERFAEGRLTQDSFVYRMDAALRARERPELYELLADMPSRRRLPDLVPDLLADFLAAVAARWQAAAPRAPARRPDIRWQPPQWPALLLPAGREILFTIGRDGDCDLVLADMTVSRRHARLERDGAGWLLADLGSTNGTRLNGWRVSSPVPVRPGDQVSFGTASYMLADGR
jgi:FHA domain/Domain of unknown function (DUF1707)